MGSFALMYLAFAIGGAVYTGISLRGLNHPEEKRWFGAMLGVQFGSVVAVLCGGAACFWGYQWLTH